jgi:hypothetical protein
MLTRMIDDIKDSTGVAIRMTSLAAAIALAFLVTIAFLCAAAFVYVLQNYGPIEACLTGAGIFFLIALIGIGVYTGKRQRKRQSRHCIPPSPIRSWWPPPFRWSARSASKSWFRFWPSADWLWDCLPTVHPPPRRRPSNPIK